MIGGLEFKIGRHSWKEKKQILNATGDFSERKLVR
jgi:hypothetical protein